MWRGKRYRMPANDFAIPRMEPGKQRSIQSMEEARDWERLSIGEVKAGRDPARRPTRAIQVSTQLGDVSAFLGAYLERYVKPAGLRSIDAIGSRIGVLKQHLGHLPLSALEDPDEINQFKTDSDYAEDVELATIHRVLETLRAAINWGMAQTPPLFTKTPFHRFGVRLNKKAETSRDRRLSRDEEKRLLDTALDKMNTPEHQFVGPILHDRIIGALELCCRRGEMLLIQNKRINWDTCQIGIPGATAKDKENRRIPFNPNWRRSSSAESISAPTRTCSAVRTARISRTSRRPGRHSDCSPMASNRSQEGEVRNGTRSSFGASTCPGTTCVTRAPVGCWPMASTSGSSN
jgi:integrase